MPSLWTYIPTEVKERILWFAGPFTMRLNHLPLPDPLPDHVAHSMWVEVFQLDYEGPQMETLLPIHQLPGTLQGLLEVRSRRMYFNLCGFRPDLQAPLDYIHFPLIDTHEIARQYRNGKEFPLIAMFNGWWDLLEPCEEIMAQHAIFHNCLPYIQHVVDKLGRSPSRWRGVYAMGSNYTLDPIMLAAHSGHLPIFTYLLSQTTRDPGLCISVEVIYHAAWAGHLEILQHLHTTHPHLFTDSCILDYACASRNLAVVKFLHSINCTCTTDAMDNAAREGSLEILFFLHQNRTEGCTSSAPLEAAMMGHLSVLQFLQTHYELYINEMVVVTACIGAHAPILDFLLNTYPDRGYTRLVVETALTRENVEVLGYMYSKCFSGGGFPQEFNDEGMWGPRVLVEAAETGKEKSVKFLVGKFGKGDGGSKYLRQALSLAEQEGKMKAVEILRGLCEI
ncbi:hypothetical protein HDV05_002919 [Chytridiales sp. JEL 0842]|nr:hypothetical protein HDV05_002919 [Chytridiales sp. JEL 0842]